MSDVTQKIRSRGHWEVTIRPTRLDKERVPYSDLDDIVESAVVRMRGWPVPMIDHRREILRTNDWIGQDVDAAMVGHFEAWRFFSSGQFVHLRAVDADWRHEAEFSPGPEPTESFIEVWEILFYLTEVFEFAARLALGPAGDEEMLVRADLAGLKERGLVVGQQNRAEFFEPYRVQSDELCQETKTSREDLVADPRGRAVDLALEFFARFGWKPPREQLLDHQKELTERP